MSWRRKRNQERRSALPETILAAAVACSVAICVELARGADLDLVYAAFCVAVTLGPRQRPRNAAFAGPSPPIADTST